MSAPDRTVASLDDYRTDEASLRRRLYAQAERLDLIVAVMYRPRAKDIWVLAYDAELDSIERPRVQTDAPTVEAAMTAALEEMETL